METSDLCTMSASWSSSIELVVRTPWLGRWDLSGFQTHVSIKSHANCCGGWKLLESTGCLLRWPLNGVSTISTAGNLIIGFSLPCMGTSFVAVQLTRIGSWWTSTSKTRFCTFKSWMGTPEPIIGFGIWPPMSRGSSRFEPVASTEA